MNYVFEIYLQEVLNLHWTLSHMFSTVTEPGILTEKCITTISLQYNLTQKMKLQSFLKWDNSIKNVDKAVSACKTNMYTSAIWIKKALKCNLQLCKMMATLQHNLHLFKSNNRLEIYSLHNGHFLYDSNYVSSNVTFTVSGYHADTPITIKAEAIRKADSHSN